MKITANDFTGATGQTGSRLLVQALDREHVVKALVRSPEKLTIQHENLEVSVTFSKQRISTLCHLSY